MQILKNRRRGLCINYLEKESSEMMEYIKATSKDEEQICQMYEKRGYRTIKFDQWTVANDVILVYGIMEKALSASNTSICYEGKYFIPKMNTENGDKWKGASILIEQ